MWQRQALEIIERIFKDSRSRAFRKPVDEKEDQAIGYYKIIQEPMDLTTLKQNVKTGKIKNVKTFAIKFNLIWENAQIYNPPSHIIHEIAKQLQSKSKKLMVKTWTVDQIVFRNTKSKTSTNNTYGQNRTTDELFAEMNLRLLQLARQNEVCYVQVNQLKSMLCQVIVENKKLKSILK